MGIIAIDLDGTLLNQNHEIGLENKQAIIRAQEQGIEVVIATGRAHFDVAKILKKAGLSLYIIAANGGTIHTPSGEVVQTIPIPKKSVDEITKFLFDEKFYFEFIGDDGILTSHEGREHALQELEQIKDTISEDEFLEKKHELDKHFSQNGFIFLERPYTINQNLYNITGFSFMEKRLEAGMNKFKNDKELTIVTSSPYNFEFQHKYASKGQALSYLAQKLGKSLDRSMAVGDSGNDISMFEVVSDSFAMASANETVKSKAKYVTAMNNEHGVAKAIDRFLNDN